VNHLNSAKKRGRKVFQDDVEKNFQSHAAKEVHEKNVAPYSTQSKATIQQK